MEQPRLRGYPVDHDLVQITRMEREARRAQRRADRGRRRWLTRLLG